MVTNCEFQIEQSLKNCSEPLHTMYFGACCITARFGMGQNFLNTFKNDKRILSHLEWLGTSQNMESIQGLSACSNRLFWTYDGSKWIKMFVRTCLKHLLCYNRLCSTIWVTLKIRYLASFCSEITTWPRGTTPKWSKLEFSKSSRQLQMCLVCFLSAILACVALLLDSQRGQLIF